MSKIHFSRKNIDFFQLVETELCPQLFTCRVQEFASARASYCTSRVFYTTNSDSHSMVFRSVGISSIFRPLDPVFGECTGVASPKETGCPASTVSSFPIWRFRSFLFTGTIWIQINVDSCTSTLFWARTPFEGFTTSKRTRFITEKTTKTANFGEKTGKLKREGCVNVASQRQNKLSQLSWRDCQSFEIIEFFPDF